MSVGTPSTIKVLCVSHTSTVGGAERSLLDLLSGLPPEVDARVACPAPGPLSNALREAHIPVFPIPGTNASLKRDPRSAALGLAWGASATGRLFAHTARMLPHVIHANSVRAGLISVPAGRAARVPVVVHLRDRLPRSILADACQSIVAAGSQIMIANSRFTAEGLRNVTSRGSVAIVYNPVDLSRFGSPAVDRDEMRRRLRLDREALVFGVIGQITPWKGQYEAVEAFSRLRNGSPGAHLLIVGEAKFVSATTRYDNRGYARSIKRAAEELGVADRVHFLGERGDIPSVMGMLDALLVPSWEEPFGRVVVEGMALGIPVLATRCGGPAEIIDDGVDGVLLAPRSPERWTEALDAIARSPDLRRHMGARAVQRADDFALPNHVTQVCEVYRQAARRREGRRA